MARRRNGNKPRKAPTGGKPWTTERQRLWLMDMRVLHAEAQQSHKRGAIKGFRRRVLDEFVREFWKGKQMNDEERKREMGILDNVCGLTHLPNIN